jgi:hypothetical protein
MVKPESASDFDVIKAAGTFGRTMSTWLFGTTFFAILLQCHFILKDEMRDLFSVAPTVLTAATAFSREKLFQPNF